MGQDQYSFRVIFSTTNQLFFRVVFSRIHKRVCETVCVCVYMCEREHQGPAANEKLAASLTLLRGAFLLGLSVEEEVLMLGGCGSSAMADTAMLSGCFSTVRISLCSG